jgi:hypothetical protein
LTAIVPSLPRVALLFVNVNGQFTPPCPTSPLAFQSMVEPESVPEPDPVTLMLLAQVAVNDTVALEALTGVTVYFKFPHPAAGVDAVTDCHVPAKASTETVGVLGEVGVDEEDVSFLLVSRSQPAASAHAKRSAAATVDFMILIIVTYDSVLYGL